MEEGVGAGMVVYHKGEVVHQQSERLPDWATVYQAELQAIGMASRYITETDREIKYAKIFTDNQSAIKSLSNTIIKDMTVKETARLLSEATTHVRSLRVVWIKAHNGNTGNETADDLAKQGTKLPDITIPNIRLPLGQTKQILENLTVNKWAEEWDNYPHARQSKFFLHQPIWKRKELYNLDREDLGIAIRIITGHNALQYHKHNVDPESHEPFCRFCNKNEYETFIHLYTSCPRFEVQRKTILFDPNPTKESDWHINKLIQFVKNTAILEALENEYDDIEDL
jgi:ribonuclease HI